MPLGHQEIRRMPLCILVTIDLVYRMYNSFITIPSNQSISFKRVPYLVSEISDVNHHQPISFGLSLRKELTSNLSLETGLTYTLLSSDIKFVGKSN